MLGFAQLHSSVPSNASPSSWLICRDAESAVNQEKKEGLFHVSDSCSGSCRIVVRRIFCLARQRLSDSPASYLCRDLHHYELCWWQASCLKQYSEQQKAE